MGELTDHIDKMLREEESKSDAPPEPQEGPGTEPEGAPLPDNTTLEAGVERAPLPPEEPEESEAQAEQEPETPEEKPETPAPEPEKGPEPEKEPEPPPDPMDHEYEVKVEGETIRVPAKHLVANYQKALHADKMIWEAHNLRQRVESSMKSFMADPLYTLEQILTGRYEDADYAKARVKAFVSDWINRELEVESMTPEQRNAYLESRKLKLDNQRLQEEQARVREEQDQKNLEAAKKQLDLEVRAAMHNAGLRYSASLAQQILRDMYQASQIGLERSADEAAEILKQQRRAEAQKLIGIRPAGEILKSFPECADLIEASKRPSPAQRSTQQGAARPSQQAPSTKPARRQTGPQRFESGAEWLRHVEKLAR